MEPQEQDKPHRPATGTAFHVRDALHEDIPGICAVMPEAFGFMGGTPWADPGYVAQGLESCAAGLSGRQKIKVALQGPSVVGCSYSGLVLADDRQTAHTQLGVIHGIAVRPDRRRHGAASALLTACEDYLGAEGASVMLAEVRPRSVGFFAARGYATAPGPALLIPTTVGTYVHQQTTPTTTLMWKSGSAAVTLQSSGHSTILGGLLGT
ncbi:GNAT family N-acetyltransferase [Streptomyces sp. NPDC101062]|uniref:GNAT family N-acetyltransferase n=1 Tax=unclassified Streptomyces TaxID=2593676 RepID=UPI00380FC7A2